MTSTADGGNMSTETTAHGGKEDWMYQNLNAEMARRGIKSFDVARVIKRSERTARDKISGRYPFTYGEVKKIRDAFFVGMDLEYLFAVSEEQ